jgi:hypothetical protein
VGLPAQQLQPALSPQPPCLPHAPLPPRLLRKPAQQAGGSNQ